MVMSMDFNIVIKDYFKMDGRVKRLVWRNMIKIAKHRQHLLNEELDWDEPAFDLNDVLNIMLSEFEVLEQFEALQATLDMCKYYDIEVY